MSEEKPRERPPRRDVEILHVDRDLIVVNKPAGVLSAPGRGSAPTVPILLRKLPQFSPTEPFRLVHRLDREASGVMVYARTLAAQRWLVDQFVTRKVEKVYIAIVSGYVAEDGEINVPLAFDKRRASACVALSRGKDALTRYRILERIAGNTVVECRPLTGRTHQIRVHMAAIGHPLAVDPLYGGGSAIRLSRYKAGYRKSARHDERPLIERLTLHAMKLALRLPGAAEPQAFEAPLPKDMRATIAQLKRALSNR